MLSLKQASNDVHINMYYLTIILLNETIVNQISRKMLVAVKKNILTRTFYIVIFFLLKLKHNIRMNVPLISCSTYY